MDTREDTVTDGRMVTRELAEWVAGLRFEDLPREVVEEAGRAFTDFLGECLFVGATQPWGQSIADFCAREGGGQPEATIIALGKKTLSSRAAFANGTMALGFEFADFGAGSRPYPFAVTGSLALAEARQRSGKDLALAIVIGYEVMGRVFRATFQRDGHSPFYVPSVYGTVGSAAACARVLGLSPQHTTYALGLGAAFTGGTFQGHEEGAWQRSLNGGMAGERGGDRRAARRDRLSRDRARSRGRAGLREDVLRRPASTRRRCSTISGRRSSSPDRWVKRYPMNTTLHAPVEALLAIMHAHDLRHTDIEEIDAAWQAVEPFLAKHKVSTVVSAQASLPFALAVAAVRGKVGVDEFTEETVADPVIQAMIPRTVVHQDGELYAKVKNSMPGRVTVRTKDGRELTDEVLYPKGNPRNPMTEDEFKGKFMDMAVRVLGHDQADELYQRARELRGVADVADLAPLFSPHQSN